MKQQDKEKFLAVFRRRKYPRQAILFEYFLDNLFVRIETKNGLLKTEQFYLPGTVAFHLFMYVCLTDVQREAKRHLLDYFPDWCLEIKPDLDFYARWLPTQDFLNCPQLSFARDIKGFYRRKGLPTGWEDKTIRFNFGLSDDGFWTKEALMETAFAQDEMAEMKPGFDKALNILWQTMENWPLKFLQTIRPFSTLGFLAFLALPSDLFLNIVQSERQAKLDISGYRDIFFVMENMFQKRKKPEEESFCNLPEESLMVASVRYESFIRHFFLDIGRENADIIKKLKHNSFLYVQKTKRNLFCFW